MQQLDHRFFRLFFALHILFHCQAILLVLILLLSALSHLVSKLCTLDETDHLPPVILLCVFQHRHAILVSMRHISPARRQHLDAL